MPDSYNEDYYNMLKQQNYEGLLKKEIQLDNARRNAVKNTNARLGALGMQSSGYGQTATNSIEGQYLNALESANQTFQNEATNIGMQEQQAIRNDMDNRYAQVATAMSEAYNDDMFNSILTTYGLFKDDEFDYDKAVSIYGEDNANSLKLLYDNYKLNSNSSDSWSQKVMQANSYGEKDGMDYSGFQNLSKLGGFELVGTEGKSMASAYTEASNGDIYKMVVQAKNGTKEAYYFYYNGRLYQVDASLVGDRKVKGTTTFKTKGNLK